MKTVGYKALIDWIQYPVSIVDIDVSDSVYFKWTLMNEAVKRVLSVLPVSFVSGLHLQPVNPRAPFNWAQQCIETKTRFSGSDRLDYAFVEFAGASCEALRDKGVITDVVKDNLETISRLDVAIDIKVDISPTDFVEACALRSGITTSVFKSQSGETYYVGSRNSDRYIRVYHYYPPHERAEYLRVECVHRRKRATQAASSVLVNGQFQTAYFTCNALGLNHSLLEAISADKLHVIPPKEFLPDKRQSQTLKWLERSAVPSIIRLVQEGEISDLDAWLDEVIYSKLDQ